MINLDFKIGTSNWEKKLRAIGELLSSNFWADFKPVSLEEINSIEREINRKLPKEFKLFYQKFGYGSFPSKFGGDINSPDEIIENCHAPVYFITGSMTPGKEWALDSEQRKFYITYGKYNPNPEKFTRDALYLDGIYLLDLVQIGSNGCCCYHQLYVGDKHDLQYCLLTDSGTIEDKSQTFSDGLKTIFNNILTTWGDEIMLGDTTSPNSR